MVNKQIKNVSMWLYSHPSLIFFLKYTAIFVMLFVSIASFAFRNLLTKEANPFFYADF